MPDMVTGISTTLARFCAGLQADALPREVRARVPLLVTDLIGCIVRAQTAAPSAPALHRAVERLGLGGGPGGGAHGVFGETATYGPAGATFLNAAFGHALDFDDTHAAGTLHPGAPVIPAAIVAGEMAGASGADVLAAIVAGYETMCRIALALPAGDHYARGYHPTATCGVFGAAAAAGRALGLSEERIESAFGIALSQSAGSLQFLTDGAWTKPFQVGWASMAGLTAAILSSEGYRGPGAAIEGRHGFLSAYAPDPRPERVIEGLGHRFETMATGVKPYPSCRYGHAGIDAMLALRAEHGLTPDGVDEIVYGLSDAGLLLVGAPAEIKQNPVNIVGAQFSAPFVLSVALATGTMGWDSYGLLDDPVIRALLPRVTCVHDPEIEAEFPKNMSGRVTVRARGRTYSRKVVVPLGEPANFLDEAALLAKFSGLTEPVLGSHWRGLADVAMGIEGLRAIAALPRAGSLQEPLRQASETDGVSGGLMTTSSGRTGETG